MNQSPWNKLFRWGKLTARYLWADWYPALRRVGFDSLINIRPRQQNRSMEIQDQNLQESIEKIIRYLLEY